LELDLAKVSQEFPEIDHQALKNAELSLKSQEKNQWPGKEKKHKILLDPEDKDDGLQTNSEDEDEPLEDSISSHGPIEQNINKIKIAIQFEFEQIEKLIENRSSKIPTSALNKVLDVAGTVNFIKKDLSEFFTEEGLQIELNDTQSSQYIIQQQPEDKFTALRNVTLQNLDRISKKISIIKEVADKTSEPQKLSKYLDKLQCLNKLFT